MDALRVRLTPVSSYEDEAALRAIARNALAVVPDVPGWRAAPDPKRLAVVKPNWIQESHQTIADCWEPVITHPTLIAAVIAELAGAMGGAGTIALCDAPHTHANFDAILARGNLPQRLDAIRAHYPALRIEVIDLRREVWVTRDDVVVARRPNPHDPRGYARVDLGRDSLFYRHRGEGHYYGADYDVGEVNRHHQGSLHEYLIAGTPMACDLFVNLPKMKTHKKTGVTCCLKNLVGINGDKNWLPHHTEGGPQYGGDEFPDEGPAQAIERALKRMGRNLALRIPGIGPWLFRMMRKAGMRALGDSAVTLRNGNWSGNDTCWRMALDLNRALLYADMDGAWREAGSAKRYVAIVDGIVGGEGNGPVSPDAVASGLVLSGVNPAAVDAAVCRVMGFDPARIPIVRHAFDAHPLPIADGGMDAVRVLDERGGGEIALDAVAPAKAGGFTPHFGWMQLREDA